MWDLIFVLYKCVKRLPKKLFECVCLWNFMCTMCIQIPKKARVHQTSRH